MIDHAPKSGPPATTRPCVAIVGAGQVGRALARQLAPHWRVQLVERDPRVVAELQARGSDSLMVTTGDGTSRLVLERAGVASAAALVTATGDEEANLECARIAREILGVRRVLAIVHDPSHVGRFTALGVEPIQRSNALATLIYNRIERAVQMAESIGLGQGEIVEVTVEPTSPAVDRPLRSFQPRDWLLAAIYRQDELQIPHGDTTIQAGDRLLLVGRPRVLPAIAEFLRGGIPRFPMPYGHRVAAIDTPGRAPTLQTEVDYLLSWSQADRLDPTNRTTGEADAAAPPPPEQLLTRALSQSELGCLVMPPESFGWPELLGLRTTLLWRALRQAHCPVLVARGSFPYRRILLPVTLHRNAGPASRLALSLTHLLGASLTAVTVTAPAFVAGQSAIEEQARALADTVALAEAQRLAINVLQLAGNPIREILTIAGDYDLVILAHRSEARRWSAVLQPDVSSQIAHRCCRSTLILPVRAEDERVV